MLLKDVDQKNLRSSSSPGPVQPIWAFIASNLKSGTG